MAKGIGRNGELFKILCDPEHLIESARDAARGKRRKPDVAKFLLNLEPECFRLARELASGVWQPGGYRSFHIIHPKPRMISCAPFEDRVVHHAIVSVLTAHFERRFVAHSYACRVGKGTHRALARAAHLTKTRAFVLRGDVVKFFPSIDHEVVKREVRRAVCDEALLRVLDQIIDGSNPQEPVQEWYAGDDLFSPLERRRGLPIGNQTSQFLANVLLDRLDHAVMDQSGFGDYTRYCDDFLVFADDREALWDLRAKIEGVLETLRLSLHPRKGGVHATKSTIPFLGFTIKRGQRRLKHDSVVRATRRLRAVGRQVAEGLISCESLRARIAAWVGHASHASSPRVIDTVLARARLAGAPA
ncbi:MAG: RNA-dependent DNA polymerase [Phycisphaerales bacterium]|nr:RNA-dependent DNA polymerase [Phycisphaerales bacterium]